MANITAAMVKELREKTSAGMLDCKKALAATEGDMEAAVTWLRERGIAKAVKKEGAVAAEGLCYYAVSGNSCITFELNSQTDFVAQNAKFIALLEQVAEVIINSSANNTEEALNVEVEGKTLATIILEASGVIGEKISLRSRASNFTLKDIKDACDFAHQHNATVHVTCNIVMHNIDTVGIEEYLKSLEECGVDAIIASSPYILKYVMLWLRKMLLKMYLEIPTNLHQC